VCCRRRHCHRRLYLLSSHVSRLVHCSTTFYSTYITFFTVHYYVFTVQVLFNDYYAFISTFYCAYISFYCTYIIVVVAGSSHRCCCHRAGNPPPVAAIKGVDHPRRATSAPPGIVVLGLAVGNETSYSPQGRGIV
jgi:hypothetical protein